MSEPTALPAGAAIAALALPLDHEPVPADQIVAGAPTTASGVLDAAAPEVGVWEMSVGAMRDTEADELFVVIAGRATVEFEDGDLPPLELGVGSVARLAAGQRTVWTVHETLRKVYLA